MNDISAEKKAEGLTEFYVGSLVISWHDFKFDIRINIWVVLFVWSFGFVLKIDDNLNQSFAVGFLKRYDEKVATIKIDQWFFIFYFCFDFESNILKSLIWIRELYSFDFARITI